MARRFTKRDKNGALRVKWPPLGRWRTEEFDGV